MFAPVTVTKEQRGRARDALRKAVKRGTVVKPDACEDCGAQPGAALLDGHHHRGYEDEHALDVVWLCRSCHHRAHGSAEALAAGHRAWWDGLTPEERSRVNRRRGRSSESALRQWASVTPEERAERMARVRAGRRTRLQRLLDDHLAALVEAS